MDVDDASMPMELFSKFAVATMQADAKLLETHGHMGAEGPCSLRGPRRASRYSSTGQGHQRVYVPKQVLYALTKVADELSRAQAEFHDALRSGNMSGLAVQQVLAHLGEEEREMLLDKERHREWGKFNFSLDHLADESERAADESAAAASRAAHLDDEWRKATKKGKARPDPSGAAAAAAEPAATAVAAGGQRSGAGFKGGYRSGMKSRNSILARAAAQAALEQEQAVEVFRRNRAARVIQRGWRQCVSDREAPQQTRSPPRPPRHSTLTASSSSSSSPPPPNPVSSHSTPLTPGTPTLSPAAACPLDYSPLPHSSTASEAAGVAASGHAGQQRSSGGEGPSPHPPSSSPTAASHTGRRGPTLAAHGPAAGPPAAAAAAAASAQKGRAGRAQRHGGPKAKGVGRRGQEGGEVGHGGGRGVGRQTRQEGKGAGGEHGEAHGGRRGGGRGSAADSQLADPTHPAESGPGPGPSLEEGGGCRPDSEEEGGCSEEEGEGEEEDRGAGESGAEGGGEGGTQGRGQQSSTSEGEGRWGCSPERRRHSSDGYATDSPQSRSPGGQDEGEGEVGGARSGGCATGQDEGVAGPGAGSGEEVGGALAPHSGHKGKPGLQSKLHGAHFNQRHVHAPPCGHAAGGAAGEGWSAAAAAGVGGVDGGGGEGVEQQPGEERGRGRRRQERGGAGAHSDAVGARQGHDKRGGGGSEEEEEEGRRHPLPLPTTATSPSTAAAAAATTARSLLGVGVGAAAASPTPPGPSPEGGKALSDMVYSRHGWVKRMTVQPKGLLMFGEGGVSRLGVRPPVEEEVGRLGAGAGGPGAGAGGRGGHGSHAGKMGGARGGVGGATEGAGGRGQRSSQGHAGWVEWEGGGAGHEGEQGEGERGSDLLGQQGKEQGSPAAAAAGQVLRPSLPVDSGRGMLALVGTGAKGPCPPPLLPHPSPASPKLVQALHTATPPWAALQQFSSPLPHLTAEQLLTSPTGSSSPAILPAQLPAIGVGRQQQQLGRAGGSQQQQLGGVGGQQQQQQQQQLGALGGQQQQHPSPYLRLVRGKTVARTSLDSSLPALPAGPLCSLTGSSSPRPYLPALTVPSPQAYPIPARPSPPPAPLLHSSSLPSLELAQLSSTSPMTLPSAPFFVRRHQQQQQQRFTASSLPSPLSNQVQALTAQVKQLDALEFPPLSRTPSPPMRSRPFPPPPHPPSSPPPHHPSSPPPPPLPLSSHQPFPDTLLATSLSPSHLPTQTQTQTSHLPNRSSHGLHVVRTGLASLARPAPAPTTHPGPCTALGEVRGVGLGDRQGAPGLGQAVSTGQTLGRAGQRGRSRGRERAAPAGGGVQHQGQQPVRRSDPGYLAGAHLPLLPPLVAIPLTTLPLLRASPQWAGKAALSTGPDSGTSSTPAPAPS